MKTVVYLNQWADLYHAMLAVVDDTTHRRQQSRFCRTLEEARMLVAAWVEKYQVEAEDVHDNSGIDLDILFAHMEIDLDAVGVSEVAGLVY